jgi:hypothetical protein
VAAARGHAVTVLGAGAVPGGKTRLHATLPGGESLSSIYDYQFLQARKYGVSFEFGVRADAAVITATRPDAIVLATGSTMLWPRSVPTLWRDEGGIPDARQLAVDLQGMTQSMGGTAVIFDMDHTEGTYALAVRLRSLVDRVVLVTPRERVAGDVALVSALGIQRRLQQQAIETMPFGEIAAESELENGLVRIRNIHSGRLIDITDVVVLTYSTPRVPDDALYDELRGRYADIHRVGDCRQPRTVLLATTEGHALGNTL